MFDESIEAARNNVKAITAPMAKMVMSISIGVSSSLPRICSNSSYKFSIFYMQLCMTISREELDFVVDNLRESIQAAMVKLREKGVWQG